MMKYRKKEETAFIKNTGDVLACRYYHGFAYPDGTDAIGDCGSKKVDNKEWDIFHIQYETPNAYYGVPMLGMGLIDCMILKKDTRPFLKNEFNYNLGMFGSHTGKFIKKFNIEIEPIVSKLSEINYNKLIVCSGFSESYCNLARFIEVYNYTYKVSDIIDSYINQYLKHYYTSYTMNICIQNNMADIKHLVKVLKKRNKKSRKQRRLMRGK